MQMIARTLALQDVLVEKGIITHAEAEARYRSKLAETKARFESDSILRLATFDGPAQ